ncbi:response regulator [Puteibacter caeruleilacunae]|nr:response regulator [Puteibacter caeruleilacunae]
MKYSLTLILLICFYFSGSSQKVEFEHLGIPDGLSQICTYEFAEDDFGRLWIATRDGLNCYNGNGFKVYKPQMNDSTKILGRRITDMVIDGNKLWTVTPQGISCLDIVTDRFIQFPMDDAYCISVVQQRVFIGTSTGIDVMNFDDQGNLKVEYNYPSVGSVNDLIIDSNKTLWICTDIGIYHIKDGDDHPQRYFSKGARTLKFDHDENIWVGTASCGVLLLNSDFKIIKQFKHDTNEIALVDDIVRTIELDTKGNIWIGTSMGLSIIDRNTHKIQNYQHVQDEPRSLSQNSIYAIKRDRQGTMWIGTYYGGINYVNPRLQIYHHYTSGELDGKHLSSPIVSCLTEDSIGNIWIGTDGGGINYLDRSKGQFKYYRHTPGKEGLSSNSIKTVRLNGNDKLYIGTHLGGFNILNISSGKYQRFHSNDNIAELLPNHIVRCIIPYGKSYLLGTYKGVFKYDPESSEFTSLIDYSKSEDSPIVVHSLLQDRHKNIWIGTENRGLFLYDHSRNMLTSKSVESEESYGLSNLTVSYLYEDRQSQIWVGTHGGGLFLFDKDHQLCKEYNTSNSGMLSDVIVGISESELGHMWVATNKGLSRLDLTEDKFYNYTTENGFPLHELTENSILRTSSGELFVGGINGLVSFHEKDLLNVDYQYRLLFSDLKVNNKKVIPGDNSGILKKSLAYTKSITLSPSHEILEIHFAACNFSSSIKSRYQYKLKGFSDEWFDLESRSHVTFTNLDPGSYELKVKVFNQYYSGVVDEAVLQINVLAPFYRTWYAFIFYALFILGIVYVINRVYLMRTRLEDKLKGEQRERERINETYKAKLNFFTNISHEFRTPLTLINGTVHSLLKDVKITSQPYKRILSVHRNTSRLLKLVNELLDFRKVEDGHLQLHVQLCNLPDFLKEICSNFEEYSAYYKINSTYTNHSLSTEIWLDPVQVEKVFYNLLSNAFKVVNKNNGTVQMILTEKEDCFQIEVKDNGPGIAPDKVNRIFDRFYQVDQMTGTADSLGSGIGLALSKQIIDAHQGVINVQSALNQGTTFTVLLKKGKEHFSSAELREGNQEVQVSSFVDEDEKKVFYKDLKQADAPVMLVVEDNQDVRNLIKGIFIPSFNILEACDGEEGLSLAAEKNPDIIISDVMMPKMSGTQMCTKLKRNVNTSHIPIILLTARTALEHKVEGLETGADDYFEKPFNAKLLMLRVRNLLNNKRLLQEKFQRNASEPIEELITNKLDRDLLKNAIAVVEERMEDTNFNVAEFAKELGMGRTRLFDKIKGVTGQTPHEFMVSVRMKKAAQLILAENDMNFSEIAYATGFTTVDAFGKSFKKYFGMSPSKFVAQKKNS